MCRQGTGEAERVRLPGGFGVKAVVRLHGLSHSAAMFIAVFVDLSQRCRLWVVRLKSGDVALHACYRRVVFGGLVIAQL